MPLTPLEDAIRPLEKRLREIRFRQVMAVGGQVIWTGKSQDDDGRRVEVFGDTLDEVVTELGEALNDPSR